MCMLGMIVQVKVSVYVRMCDSVLCSCAYVYVCGRVIVHVKVFHNVGVVVRTCGGICTPSGFEGVFESLSVRERPRLCECVSS